MDFALSDEQRYLQQAAARLLADRCPPQRVAALADAGGDDPGTWRAQQEQGWCDPELATVDRSLLAQEAGYALAATGWWSTVGLAHPVYRAADVPVPSGPLTLAWQNDPGDGGCRSAHRNGRWLLTGTHTLVSDVTATTGLVVAADSGDGPALFAVPPAAAGLTIVPEATVDPLRPASRVTFDSTPADLLVAPESGARVLADARRHAGTLLAGEAVGVARRALGLATRHACQRSQFGRPIGTYQAVSHRLADSYVAIELATSLALRAAWLVGEAPSGEEADRAYAQAVVAARKAAVQSCEDALQVFGGLGATWEYPLHWWYRRALWLDCFDTPTTKHLARLADGLLSATPAGF